MKEGEKYLSCKIKKSKLLELFLEATSEKQEYVNFAVFPNKRDKPEQPHYKNDFCGVWINKKKGSTEVKEEKIEQSLDVDIAELEV